MRLVKVERPLRRLKLFDACRHFLRGEKIHSQVHAGHRDAKLLRIAEAMDEVPKSRRNGMDIEHGGIVRKTDSHTQAGFGMSPRNPAVDRLPP